MVRVGAACHERRTLSAKMHTLPSSAMDRAELSDRWCTAETTGGGGSGSVERLRR